MRDIMVGSESDAGVEDANNCLASDASKRERDAAASIRVLGGVY